MVGVALFVSDGEGYVSSEIGGLVRAVPKHGSKAYGLPRA